MILPYSCGSVIHRILNILILLSSLFLWYLIITHQEALHWYFFDELPKCTYETEISQVGDNGNHGNPGDKISHHGNQVKQDSLGQVGLKVELKEDQTTVRNKFKPPDVGLLNLSPESQNIQERFKERNKVIKEVCETEKFPDFEQSNMYYFPALKATWLPLFGASSTLWKRFFIDQYTTRRRHGDQYNLGYLGKFLLQYKMGKKGSGRKTRSYTAEPDNSMRFTVIRHPLSRLIAHFRKPQLEKGELAALKDQWVLPSILLGRTDPSWTDEQKRKFEQELNDWIDGKLTPEQSPNNPLLSPPTFPEFVRFIIDTNDKGDERANNVHWRSISEWLDICQNDIDIVVKQENVKLEIPVLLEKLDLTSHEGYFLENAGEADNIDVKYYMGQLIDCVNHLPHNTVSIKSTSSSICFITYNIVPPRLSQGVVVSACYLGSCSWENGIE
eukprot:sb/3464730/